MAEIFDPDSVRKLREMPPREAYQQVKDTLFRMGGVSSDEFAAIFDEMVERGILTGEELEAFTA